MKIRLLPIYLFLTTSICSAQKKNYFSVEYGAYFGNANTTIESNMTSSGFGDKQVADFFGLFTINTNYPRKEASKSSYRIRAGHQLNNKIAIEAGFGLSYNGAVSGFDDRTSGGGGGNYLTLASNINTLYIAFVKTDEQKVAGVGIGPAFSFYKLKTDMNNGNITQNKNYFLPGAMVTGFWNFIHRPSWYMGMRTDFSFTAPAKISEIKVTNPGNTSIVSTFKATKAGSFNGCVTLTAGLRFN